MPQRQHQSGALIALAEPQPNQPAARSKPRTSFRTGLAVASAKDNGAIWAIAQSERATVSSLDAVKSSLQTGQSVIDVANSAGTTVSNLLTQMEQKALAASDTSLDTASRAALNTDFVALRNQITSTVADASFNGVNLLDGSVTKITSLANAQGTSVLTTLRTEPVAGRLDRHPGGDGDDRHGDLGQLGAHDGRTPRSPNVDNALAALGTSSKALDTHLNFVSNLQDTLTTGIGNLVNADLAKESATLQALQTKQQLGIQALSIANSASSALLGLFR